MGDGATLKTLKMYISDISEDDIEIAIKVKNYVGFKKIWAKKTSANSIQMFTQQPRVAGLGSRGPQKNPSALVKSALFANFCPWFLRLRESGQFSILNIEG